MTFGLISSKAQITQDFEGPLSISWSGNGAIVGSQGGSWNTHSGGLMYKLTYGDYIKVSVTAPAVKKYIGFWVNKSNPNSRLDVSLEDYTTGNFILNLGAASDYISGYWFYKEYELGAGYSGDYNFVFKHYFNYPTAYPPTYLDDIIIDTESHISNVSVSELSVHDFKFYPTPSTNGKFNIAFKNAIENLSIELFDVTGKLAYVEKASVFANENKEISTALLTNGIYMCKISNATSTFMQKIIVQ